MQEAEEEGEKKEATGESRAEEKSLRRWDNWWPLHYEAKRRGVRNWLIALTGLERTGLIEKHRGDIWVPEELVKQYNTE